MLLRLLPCALGDFVQLVFRGLSVVVYQFYASDAFKIAIEISRNMVAFQVLKLIFQTEFKTTFYDKNTQFSWFLFQNKPVRRNIFLYPLLSSYWQSVSGKFDWRVVRAATKKGLVLFLSDNDLNGVRKFQSLFLITIANHPKIFKWRWNFNDWCFKRFAICLVCHLKNVNTVPWNARTSAGVLMIKVGPRIYTTTNRALLLCHLRHCSQWRQSWYRGDSRFWVYRTDAEG